MPIIIIRSLPPSDPTTVDGLLGNVCVAGARALGCPLGNVWAIFEEIPPGRYVEGSAAAVAPQPSTHPPVVSVQALQGRSPEVRHAFLQAVSTEIGAGLGIPAENVWIHYQEMAPWDVWTNGGPVGPFAPGPDAQRREAIDAMVVASPAESLEVDEIRQRIGVLQQRYSELPNAFNTPRLPRAKLACLGIVVGAAAATLASLLGLGRSWTWVWGYLCLGSALVGLRRLGLSTIPADLMAFSDHLARYRENIPRLEIIAKECQRLNAELIRREALGRQEPPRPTRAD